MTTVRRMAVATIVGVGLMFGVAASPAAAQVPDHRAVDGVDGVEEILRDRLDASAIPGAAFVVVHRDGRSDGRGVGGTAGDDEITSRTPFVIGSTTKSFTALAVMQLVDAGAVELDAPALRYVPELRLADGEATDTITVRHLLQQTSGLPGAAGGPVLASAADGTAVDAVRELDGVHLASAPGTRWQYSNANYVLAGLVVERPPQRDMKHGWPARRPPNRSARP